MKQRSNVKKFVSFLLFRFISGKRNTNETGTFIVRYCTLYTLRSHCTKFGALFRRVTIKTIRHQTSISQLVMVVYNP